MIAEKFCEHQPRFSIHKTNYELFAVIIWIGVAYHKCITKLAYYHKGTFVIRMIVRTFENFVQNYNFSIHSDLFCDLSQIPVILVMGTDSMPSMNAF
jgi:hypothetical protein